VVPLNLHKYETQAKLSLWLAIVSVLCCIAAVFLLMRNFVPQDQFVYYNPRGLWLPALGGALFLCMLTGGVGFLVGILSAGQRRNSAAGLSWTGFFLSAAGITIGLCAGLFFYFTRNAIG